MQIEPHVETKQENHEADPKFQSCPPTDTVLIDDLIPQKDKSTSSLRCFCEGRVSTSITAVEYLARLWTSVFIAIFVPS